MTAYVKSLARSAAGSAMLIALAASPASAQAPTPAQSPFFELSFAQVVAGRDLWITTSDGSRQKARVVSVGPTGLSATTGGQSQMIRFDEITRIEKATHRVRTHTIIGLSIGSGIGLFGSAFCDGWGGCVASNFLTWAGIGAGIGALNGAIKNSLNRDDDLIYEARPRTTTVTMAIAPMLSRTRKGVAFSLTWR